MDLLAVIPIVFLIDWGTEGRTEWRAKREKAIAMFEGVLAAILGIPILALILGVVMSPKPQEKPDPNTNAPTAYSRSIEEDTYVITTEISSAAKECVRNATDKEEIAKCMLREARALTEAKIAVYCNLTREEHTNPALTDFTDPLVKWRFGVLEATRACRKRASRSFCRQSEERALAINEGPLRQHSIAPIRSFYDKTAECSTGFLAGGIGEELKSRLPTVLQRHFGNGQKKLNLAITRR